MEYQHITVAYDDGVATLTLDRPDRRNALSLDLMTEVTAALTDLGTHPDVQAVVIAGAGSAFSAGHDLNEIVDRDHAFYDKLFDACTAMMLTIHRIPQPVVAKVHGIATAAGCQLVASCDLVVASSEARFATPGVKIGLFCSTPMVPISRAVGRKRAMQMLLTGDAIDATTARDWGLVNIVADPDELDEALTELLASITRFSPVTIGIGKEAFYRQIELSEPDAYALTQDVMAHNAALRDAQEGIGAFLEKRSPVWSHQLPDSEGA